MSNQPRIFTLNGDWVETCTFAHTHTRVCTGGLMVTDLIGSLPKLMKQKNMALVPIYSSGVCLTTDSKYLCNE